MKNRIGLLLLILICVALIVAMVWNHQKATEQHQADAQTIGTVSNQLVQTTSDLEDVRKRNAELSRDREARDAQLLQMTNQLTDVSSTLAKTEAMLKDTEAQRAKEVAERDARITALTSQNQALDQRAEDLSAAITNLTSQIDDTQKKLAASEGDKAFLQKELTRLMNEKAQLEKQFNDLKVLRTQVAKLQEELTIARRLDWIRQGLFARDGKKGAQLLMENNTPAFPSASPTNAQPKSTNYDLNVEVSSDGTVKVIPPLSTNAPANK